MNFKNCPLIDFTIPSEIERFKSTLREQYEMLSKKPPSVPIIIGGEAILSDEQVPDLDPSTEHAIATIHYADIKHVEQALASLSAGQERWAKTTALDRSTILRSAADAMEAQRFELASLLVIEAGKPWAEADADVAEGIDFCRYYAEQMDALAPVRKTAEVTGEHSTYFYQPRGITAVIAPWNFPFAIPCGMTVAALVAGNPVVLKPAEQTSLIAQRMVSILHEAGVPHDALAFLPGRGEVIGAALVESPLVHMIVFTGSRAVGLRIIEQASILREGQHHIKKVVAELGGKNAIIVDEDADLDEAIKGVLYSSFGFSGQKCSACSRVIVVGDAYEPFVKRLAHAARDLIYGSAHDPGIFFGPVIDQETQERLLAQQEKAKQESECLFQGDTQVVGFIVPAAVYTNVPVDSWIWTAELFGPVVAVGRAARFEEAVTIATDSEYALTGGVFSRSPKNIEYAIREFAVGNLYINRGCTGAIVCRHPFGGFKLSGIGSKAGGPDYLLQFLEPRTVTENTMRRGFTPDLTT